MRRRVLPHRKSRLIVRSPPPPDGCIKAKDAFLLVTSPGVILGADHPPATAMDRREELKARAREHERNDQPEHALEICMALLPDTSGAGLGALLSRIGSLQEKIGSPAAAVESFLRAASAFVDAGQPNNAVAVTQRVLRLDPAEPRGQQMLGDLSLSQGLRDFARAGVYGYAKHSASVGAPDGALRSVAAYLGRYPDDGELWGEWKEALVAAGHAEKVAPLLERLLELLHAEGHSAAADRLSRERVGVRGGGAQGRADVSGPMDQDLLLESHHREKDADDSLYAPLEGLESSGSGGVGFVGFEDEDGVGLPLLGNLPELEGVSEGDRNQGPRPTRSGGVERLNEEDTASRSVSDSDPAGYATRFPHRDAHDVEPTGSPDAFDPAPIISALREHAGVSVDPADPASHYDLGLAYKEMDRLDESVANLAMAMQGGHDPAAVMEVVGEILVTRGEYLLADDLLRRLPGVERDAMPEHVGVHYWLARAAEKSGRRREARRALQHVVSLDSNFRDAADRLRHLL